MCSQVACQTQPSTQHAFYPPPQPPFQRGGLDPWPWKPCLAEGGHALDSASYQGAPGPVFIAELVCVVTNSARPPLSCPSNPSPATVDIPKFKSDGVISVLRNPQRFPPFSRDAACAIGWNSQGLAYLLHHLRSLPTPLPRFFCPGIPATQTPLRTPRFCIPLMLLPPLCAHSHQPELPPGKCSEALSRSSLTDYLVTVSQDRSMT